MNFVKGKLGRKIQLFKKYLSHNASVQKIIRRVSGSDPCIVRRVRYTILALCLLVIYLRWHALF